MGKFFPNTFEAVKEAMAAWRAAHPGHTEDEELKAFIDVCNGTCQVTPTSPDTENF